MFRSLKVLSIQRTTSFSFKTWANRIYNVVSNLNKISIIPVKQFLLIHFYFLKYSKNNCRRIENVPNKFDVSNRWSETPSVLRIWNTLFKRKMFYWIKNLSCLFKRACHPFDFWGCVFFNALLVKIIWDVQY